MANKAIYEGDLGTHRLARNELSWEEVTLLGEVDHLRKVKLIRQHFA